MSATDEFLNLFDSQGRFRAGGGAVNVAFLTNTGRRYPGRLEFEGGLCVSADMEGSAPWVYPDRSPLSGLRFNLSFDHSEPLTIVVHEGRVLTPDVLQTDARLAEAFAQADRSGVVVNQRARTAFLSLSVQEQIAVLEAVAHLANQPATQWPTDIAPRLGSDNPVYLLRVSEDLHAFIRVLEGRQQQSVELLDVVREATLEAFVNRSRVISGAK